MRVEFSCNRKAERNEEQTGKTSTGRCRKGNQTNKSVTTKPKNEPVAGRNIFHRAGPCKGAKSAPWIWIGGTKEVRTLRKCEMILVDTGGTSP